MPEQHTPDLDQAFDALVRDVDRVARPRGADVAVRSARRRRTALVAGVAAAVLAVGGVGWAAWPGGDAARDPQVAALPDLPAPRPFGADQLGEQYGAEWRQRPSPTLTDPLCTTGAGVRPRTERSLEFRQETSSGPTGWAAALTYLRFADQPTTSAATEVLNEGWSQCDVAPTSERGLNLGPGAFGYVASYPAADGEEARDQLLVTRDERLVLLTVVRAAGGGPDPGPLDDAEATSLATDLLAGLLAERG